MRGTKKERQKTPEPVLPKNQEQETARPCRMASREEGVRDQSKPFGKIEDHGRSFATQLRGSDTVGR